MIGGKAQAGEWRIDARYNRSELVRRIERIAARKDRIVVTGDDARLFLRKIGQKLPDTSLIYLDPPYYIKGQRRLYANYYEAEDHALVAEDLSDLNCHWLVSYDQAPEIRQLYAAYRSLSYTLRYSASTVKSGDETMFFSEELSVPRSERPPNAILRSGKTSACAA